jgi:hypothetical protein
MPVPTGQKAWNKEVFMDIIYGIAMGFLLAWIIRGHYAKLKVCSNCNGTGFVSLSGKKGKEN